ncbi:thioredoxin family protein [Candidatus Woesearchaeota archaeon]|nr:thioredoxin family protein [Candidatus Woesearchaeota archaeon]
MKAIKKIIMFHGSECPHCKAMMPLADRLEKETRVKVEKKEVWHDEKNAAEMRLYAKKIRGACNGHLGVPCFLSKKKGKALCGEVPFKEFKAWAERI